MAHDSMQCVCGGGAGRGDYKNEKGQVTFRHMQCAKETTSFSPPKNSPPAACGSASRVTQAEIRLFSARS